MNIIGAAQELDYIQIPDGCLINIEELKNYPKDQTVLITTGSQGEPMAALSRMAANVHRKVRVEPGDTIILSSTPIPGNEKAVSSVINELTQLGAKVIFQDVHVSGHACQEEIKLMYSLVKPRYSIPIHGEFRHLQRHAQLVEELGIPADRTFIMHSGDVLEMDDEGAALNGRVQAGSVMVDGLGVGDVGNIVLRDRQTLAQHGIIIVVAVLERGSNMLLSGPDIVTRGFVYVRENEELMEEMRAVVMGSIMDCQERRINDWSRMKNVIRDDLGDYLWKRMKRSPMILPIIMEA